MAAAVARHQPPIPETGKVLSDRDRRVLKLVAPFVAPDSFVEGRESGWLLGFVDGRLGQT